MIDRAQQLGHWLNQLGFRDYSLNPASEDASFRRYLRLRDGDESLIVMDAPPQQEPCDQFIEVAGMLRGAGLSAPEVIAAELEQGFLLLTDFGSDDYLSRLDAQTEAALYTDALDALRQMQTGIDAADLPDYDAALLIREMDLFRDWFLGKLLGLGLDDAQQAEWLAIRQTLVSNALEQPRVFVHRDYHSRNLMHIDAGNPGILDFQDAVRGPLTYDLVSLLRDCYIAWAPARVEQLALDYYAHARADGLVEVEAAEFLRWFNLMGVQRHLKAIGIFSRLKIRDDKDGYLRDIPRTLEYIHQVSAAEPSLAGLATLVDRLDLGRRVRMLAP